MTPFSDLAVAYAAGGATEETLFRTAAADQRRTATVHARAVLSDLATTCPEGSGGGGMTASGVYWSCGSAPRGGGAADGGGAPGGGGSGTDGAAGEGSSTGGGGAASSSGAFPAR